LQNGSIDAYDFIIHGESSSGNSRGSYILLDSTTPAFVTHLNLPDSDGIVDLDLIRISPDDFIMRSSNWIESTVTENALPSAVTTSGYNVRSGPGTNYNIVGTTSSNKTVTIYEGPTSGTGASSWYRIGDG
jgi:hypothetical protein